MPAVAFILNHQSMLISLVLIAFLITINVFASRSVRHGSDAPFKQNMLIAMIWLVPVVGVFMAFVHTSPPPAEPTARLPLPGTVDGAPPWELCISGSLPLSVDSHLRDVNGFPVMDWDALKQWMATDTSSSGRQAAIRAWLLHMREACGPTFRLYETDDAYVLSPLDNGVLCATAAYIATTRKRVQTVLHGVAKFASGEKSILLVMDDEDMYYKYVAAYYPDDGEFAGSGGMFINAGCPHFVVTVADLSAIEPVIAHEVTHSALAHLALPRWLDEGLAVNTEQRLTGVPLHIYSPRELSSKHVAYWGEAEIAQFWSGASFFRPDDGTMLSYDLARILVAQLSGNWDRFMGFVNNADRDDAGARAAREHLDVALGTLVCALLELPYSAGWEPNFQTL
jgi:hypothetical protein